MQLIVFFVEVILIYFYLIYEENSSLLVTPADTSSYYTQDLLGDDILTFSIEMPQSEKLKLLKNSDLLQEIIEQGSNVEIMSEIFNNGIEDQSNFKEEFIYYMRSCHRKYLAQKITFDKFQEAILNPKNLNGCD